MKQVREDDGFTLLELVLAVAILAVITVSVGAAMIVGLRTTFTTAQKLNVSNNAQLLSQFFVPDVQSAAIGGVDANSARTDTGCSGAGSAPGGTNLLVLTWTD